MFLQHDRVSPRASRELLARIARRKRRGTHRIEVIGCNAMGLNRVSYYCETAIAKPSSFW
jgi:hypothetical protein